MRRADLCVLPQQLGGDGEYGRSRAFTYGPLPPESSGFAMLPQEFERCQHGRSRMIYILVPPTARGSPTQGVDAVRTITVPYHNCHLSGVREPLELTERWFFKKKRAWCSGA